MVLLTFISPLLSLSQCSEYEILNLRKTALIFGEKDYLFAPPLINPANDASDIADSLQRLGFDVHVVINADKKTMREVAEKWYQSLRNYNVGLFYYSGHGAEYNGENFLFPTDANPKNAGDLNIECFSANKLLSALGNANLKYNIVLLDACRSNPFTRSWSRDFSNGGLATMVGRGSFIGFAASPGKTASDGTGKNGTYTEAILTYIMIPGLTIDQMFTKINAYVGKATKDQQITFKNSSLNVDYCFSVKRSSAPMQPAKNSFSQPPSRTCVTYDGTLLNISDSGILAKDPLTMIDQYFVKQIYEGSANLVSRSGKIVVSLNIVGKRLLVFDVATRSFKPDIDLDERPTSIVLNKDETLAYVTFADSVGNGYYTIDILHGSVIKRSRLSTAPVNSLMSSDDKNLYILSSDSIFKINLAKDKIAASYGLLSGAKTFGISPDNKKILIACDRRQSNSTVFVDGLSLKAIKTLKFKFDLVSFTLDNSSALLVNENDIFIIDLQTDSLINRIPFNASPKGIAMTNDGVANIWIPNEKRYYVLNLKEVLKTSSTDPEVKLKNFKEAAKNDYDSEIADRGALWSYFDTLHQVYEGEINAIVKELGDKYHTTPRRGVVILNGDEINGFRYDLKAYGNNYGIFNFDNSRSINTHLIASVRSDSIYVDIHSVPENSAELETYKRLKNQTDWDSFRFFVKNYFVQRLDKLRAPK